MNWLIRISDLKHRKSRTTSSIRDEQYSLPTFRFIWVRFTIKPYFKTISKYIMDYWRSIYTKDRISSTGVIFSNFTIIICIYNLWQLHCNKWRYETPNFLTVLCCDSMKYSAIRTSIYNIVSVCISCHETLIPVFSSPVSLLVSSWKIGSHLWRSYFY